VQDLAISCDEIELWPDLSRIVVSQKPVDIVFDVDTEQIVGVLKQERDRIATRSKVLEESSNGRMSAGSAKAQRNRSGRHLSAEARRRIAVAQRRRWAAIKRAKKS
jgi:hypothetical protein